MKKYLMLILLGLSLSLISCDNDDDKDEPGDGINYQVRTETIQSNSTDEIFYNLETGLVKSVTATDWHLAFETSIMSVTIRPHFQSKVWEVSDLAIEDFPYDFSNMSDSASWIERYNDNKSWAEGSFNINDNGHPDYGWGSYDDLTHTTNGTRLYMYNFNNGAVNVSKQIVVDRHDITNNSIIMRIADVDGSNVQEITVNKGDFTDKSFVYYNLITNQAVDHQPMKGEWDFVIKNYNAAIPAGPSIVYYPVSGMMSNGDLMIAEIPDLEDAKNEPYNSAAEFSQDIDVIGYDWKSFVNGSYTIATDRAYFVKKTLENDEMAVYRLVFNNYENGMYDFDIQRIKVEN